MFGSQNIEILVMYVSVYVFSEVVLECKYNGQFPLSCAPAGNHGSCIYHLGLDICLVVSASTPVLCKRISLRHKAFMRQFRNGLLRFL